jgi:hypothetical protein
MGCHQQHLTPPRGQVSAVRIIASTHLAVVRLTPPPTYHFPLLGVIYPTAGSLLTRIATRLSLLDPRSRKGGNVTCVARCGKPGKDLSPVGLPSSSSYYVTATFGGVSDGSQMPGLLSVAA